MTGFTARYRDTCEDCDDDIFPGQQAVYVGEGLLAHVRCPHPGVLTTSAVCPVHHIALPASGICDDCD